MPIVTKIVPCLWFDHEAEEAATFYTGIFPRSKITRLSRYPAVGQEIHGRAPGTVMTVEFELDGQRFTALNGGPVFKFNEAVSLQIECENQDEVDHFWRRLGEGGPREAQQCGWVKDKYGLSWQVVPKVLGELMTDADPRKVERAFKAMLGMKKLDIAALKMAHAG